MSTHARWVYPDAPATTRGVLMHSDEDEAAYREKCAKEDATQVPVINGNTSRSPEDASETDNADSEHDKANETLAAALIAAPAKVAPEKNKGGRPRKAK